MLDSNTKSLDDAVRDLCHLCRVARQIMIPAHTPATVLIRCQGAGIMKIEMHRIIVDRQRCMTGQDLMELLPENPSFVYITNLTTKPVNFPEFMIVAISSNAPTCRVHLSEDGQPRVHSKEENTTHSKKNDNEHSIKDAHYKLPSAARSTLIDTAQ